MDLFERRHRMLGLGLATGLTLSALVTNAHWGWFLAKLIVGAALIAYLALNFRRDHLNQTLTVELAGVPPEAAEAAQRDIREALGPFSVSSVDTPEEGEPVRVRFQQSDSAARVVRALRKLGPKAELVGAQTTLRYTALSAHGQAEVQVSGVAPAGAKVVLPGLDEPAVADAQGRFSAQVPFREVRRHERGGVLRGEWAKGEARDVVEVRVGAAS